MVVILSIQIDIGWHRHRLENIIGISQATE